MERHEKDRVVVAHDRLGAVSVVDVPVEDRHAGKSQLRLRVAGGDDDVVDETEAHRSVGQSVVPRWTDQRKTTSVDGL